MKLLLVAALLAAPSLAAADPLDLVCVGLGTWTESNTSFGNMSATNAQGSTYGSGTVTNLGKGRGQVQVRIQLDDANGGRIKMPPDLVPPLRTGGKDGWWRFSELLVSDDQINAKFALNVLNRVKVVIDRRLGDIDLRGLGLTFTGSCERAPEAPEERKF